MVWPSRVALASSHTPGPPVVDRQGKIADAAKKVEEHSVLNLHVERVRIVASSVSRHDLLWAWIGLGLGMGI